MKVKFLIIYLFVFNDSSMAGEKDELRIGAGAVVRENFRRGNNLKFQKNDPMILPIPFLKLRIDRFELSRGFKIHVIDKPPYWFSFDIIPMGHTYRNVNMSKRRESFAAGSEIKVMFLNLSYFQDISNKSRAAVTKIGVSKRFVFNDNHFMATGLEYKRYSANYTDYYFGVRPEEVNGEREAFVGNKSSSIGANIFMMSKLSEKVSAFNTVSYNIYSKEIYQSPTVSKKHEWSFMTSLSYKIF
jgi:outer membrane scaffolding protein for murein synthesis (MipA/OmpV family)